MKQVYLGGPLFSEMEQMYNAQLANRIRSTFGDKISLYSPQENEAINDKSGFADSIMIAQGDNEYLEKTDVLIAIIDGQTVDVGLAAEIGFYYSLNKPIIALYSDVRQGVFGNQEKLDALDEVAESQFSYVNLYLVGLIKQRGIVVQSTDELIEELAKHV